MSVVHETHRMSPFKSTIITVFETSRFGKIRHCVYCGAEEAVTNTSGQWGLDSRLREPCLENKKARKRPVVKV